MADANQQFNNYVPELPIFNIIFTSIMNLRFIGHDTQISTSAISATGDITKDAAVGTRSSLYHFVFVVPCIVILG